MPPRQHPLLCPTIVCPPRRTCAPAQTFIPMHRLRCQPPSAPEILHLRALCARSRASCAWTAHPAVPSRFHLGPGSPAGVCRHRLAEDWRIRRRIRNDLTSGLRELVPKGEDGVSLSSQLFKSGVRSPSPGSVLCPHSAEARGTKSRARWHPLLSPAHPSSNEHPQPSLLPARMLPSPVLTP